VVRDRLLTHLRETFHQEAKGRPIFLTGFMGVGKSVVAATLARKLNRTFVDTDRMIEEKEKLSVAEIFSQKGELHFRLIEKQTIAELSLESNRVIALGGGALMDPESLRTVKKKGTLVFLDADVDALEERLQRTISSRPLLAGLSAQERGEKVRLLLGERMPIYRQAELSVKTDGHRPDEVAELIIRELSEEIREKR